MTGAGLFTHINTGFRCENCGENVPPADRGCRNHCPFCLTSKHVDINPGDRSNTCLGLLKAISYDLDGKKGIILNFQCSKCGAKTRNKALRTGATPDNYEKYWI